MKKQSIAMVILAAFLAVFAEMPAYAANKDPYDGFSTTQLDGSNITTYNISSGYLGSTGAGNYFYYENINFGTVSPTSVELEIGVPEEYAGATVEIRIDSPTGPLLASIVDQPSSFDTALTHTAQILTPVTGVHTLYIKTGDKTANFFMIKFNKPLTGQDVYTVFETEDAFLDIQDSPYRAQINALKQLGFLGEDLDDYFYPQMFMKRKDFAQILFRVLNTELNKRGEQAFLDVTPDMECYAVVNSLAERGIVVGYNDGYFYPEEFITKSDAMVMICQLLGYGDLAEFNGGYPQGYLKFATDQKLYAGLDSGEYLRNGEMARLMCNMFEAYYLELDTVSATEGATYKEIKGILSKTMDIYEGKGLVTATNNTSLNAPDTSLDFEHVEIDGAVYHVGATSAKALLGYECDFYYQSEDNDEDRTLVAIMPRASVRVATLTSIEYDFEEITTERITYSSIETGKRERISLDSDTAILYNGVAIDGALEDFIEKVPLRGSIRYIQNPTGKDVVFIDEYINIRIGMVDRDNEEISDALTDTAYLFEDDAFYCIKDGEPVDYSRLSVGDIAMMYRSKNRTGDKMVRLIVGGSVVSGSISSKTADEITVDGSTYQISDEFIAQLKMDFDESYTGSQEEYEAAWQTAFAAKTAPGTSGTFYINTYMELVYFEASAAGVDKVGMILSIMPNTDGAGEASHVKMLTTDNEVVRYQTAEKIYIDGVRLRDNDEIAEHLSGLKAIVTNMPARYQLNEQNQLTMLDTEVEVTGDQRDTLTKLFSSTAYNYGSGTRILINSSTGKGTIPFSSDGWLLSKWENAQPDQYSFSKGGLSDSGNSGDVYTLNPDNETCDIFVWINRGLDYGAQSMVIDEVRQTVGQDNEIYYNVVGIIGTERVEYPVTEEILAGNSTLQAIVRGVKRGDCLRIGTNSKNEINSMDLLYLRDGRGALDSVDENGTAVSVTPRVSAGNRVWSDGGQKYRAVCATAVENTGEYLKVSIGETLQDDIEYIYTKNTNVVKYDSKRDSLEDGLSSSSIKKGDQVFIYISDRGTRTVAVYR